MDPNAGSSGTAARPGAVATQSVTDGDGLAAGIDVGSRTCKVVLLDGDASVLDAAVEESGIEADETARSVLQDLLAAQSLAEADLESIVATGYGRGNVEFADKNVTEITCHARGVVEMFPQARGVIDIGGQDSKVIKLDGDQVVDFAMNDKCAAGTGKFLESMAETLEIDLSEMGTLEQAADEVTPLSSTCAVFAESEVISQIHQGAGRSALVAGICESVVDQIMGQVERVGIEPPIAMTGGVARNEGVLRRLEAALETDLLVPEEPQIVGAHGAALLPH